MLDELLIGGEVQETSKKNVLKAIAAQDLLQEVSLTKLLCKGQQKLTQTLNLRRRKRRKASSKMLDWDK